MLIGKYVATFAEATHALPDGMHMNADYPFMLPKIKNKTARSITIAGRGNEIATVEIQRNAKGDEFAELQQSSTFERIYNLDPSTFRLLPFLQTEA